MAEEKHTIIDEFEEFLKAREEAAKESPDEDEEIELWNKDGAGGRVRRSRAPEFAKRLGIPWTEDEPEKDDKTDDKTGTKTKRTSTGKQSTGQTGIARKYFAPKKS